MRKEKTLLVLGVWITILPFLGFPQSWKTVFFVVTGLAFIYLSYIFYQEARSEAVRGDNKSKAFVDNIAGKE